MRIDNKTKPAPTLNDHREAVAILVHGTYADSPQDVGDNWWQSGSDSAKKLQSLVPDSVRVAEEGQVFHWSGENSERARMKAARQLAKHVQRLDAEGKDYHLVGHSHGGSVIWKALQLSLILRRPMRGLRSWTTVGTPFLQHRSRSTWNVINWLGLIFGLVLLRPAFRAPLQLLKMLSSIVSGGSKGVVLDPDEAVGYVAIFRAPVIAVVELLGVAVDRRSDGIHIGSYDPESGLSLAAYFFTTTEGLFLLAVTIAMSYFFMHVAMLCIKPAIESYRIRLEQSVARRAFGQYGSRWLGIWSPDDEAINGLRATLDLSVSFLGKLAPPERVFLSDIISLLSRPYYWLMAPLYNRVVHPTLDGTIRTVVLRAAQGNDRPTATLIDVTPSPIPDLTTAAPLPELLNAKLLSFANRHAHELVPQLRKLLARPSFSGGLQAFGQQLSGKELVHTAYFEQDDVLRLIAANINWETNGVDHSEGSPPMATWLTKWFASFKQLPSTARVEDPSGGPCEDHDRKPSGDIQKVA